MSNGRRGAALWLALVAVTVIAGIAVPYGVLSGSAAALDVTLFWLAFGLVVIGVIAAAVARWRD